MVSYSHPASAPLQIDYKLLENIGFFKLLNIHIFKLLI